MLSSLLNPLMCRRRFGHLNLHWAISLLKFISVPFFAHAHNSPSSLLLLYSAVGKRFVLFNVKSLKEFSWLFYDLFQVSPSGMECERLSDQNKRNSLVCYCPGFAHETFALRAGSSDDQINIGFIKTLTRLQRLPPNCSFFPWFTMNNNYSRRVFFLLYFRSAFSSARKNHKSSNSTNRAFGLGSNDTLTNFFPS